MLLDAVLDDRFTAGYLLQGLLPALIIEFLETIKTVSTVAHNLTGLRYVAEHLGKLQQARFVLDDLLLCRHYLIFFS